MTSRSRLGIAAFFVAFLVLHSTIGGEREEKKSRIKEGAYYEFRGHISDRNTLEKTFTLGWDKGSQIIAITAETKVFRKGHGARLEDAKAGDAVRGVGRALKGKLIAVAVAFGDEGVELPPGLKMPDSITLPPPQSSE